MAKGKLLKTKIKEQARLKKADWKLKLKKPLELSIREHLGKFIDNMKVDDAAFLVSWIGVAMILAASLDFLKKMRENIQHTMVTVAILATWLHPRLQEALKDARVHIPKTEEGGITLQEWVIIFAVSYLIVKHFGTIMQTVGSIGQGVTKLGLSLLG